MQDDQTTNAGEDETEDLEHEEAEQEEQEEQEEHEEEAEGEEEDSDLAKAPTDPAPPKPLSELAQRVFRSLPDAYTVEEEWATTEGIQGVLNAQPGAEFLAVQVVDGALAELFNRNLVDKLGGPPDKWRESDSVVVARVARVIAELHQGPISMESLEGDPRESEALDLLVDAGLVAIADGKAAFAAGDSPHELRIDIHVATSVVEASRAVEAPATRIDAGEAKLLIQEIAEVRKKAEEQRRRANELASWIGRKGFSEQDALDEVRGVTVTAKPRREEFEWTSSRIVDSAEKGVIFGEVLELENEVAAIRLESEGHVSDCKGRIKALEGKIRDLKNAAACNSRVISCRAYRRTDWSSKKVIVRAVDDDRVLAEEDLPHGTQRTIESVPVAVPENGRRAAEIVAQLAAVTADQLADFAARAKEKGWKISLDFTKTGAERVTEIEAPTAEKAEEVVALPPLPKDEAELAEAAFATTDGATEAIGFDAIVRVLEERFELPAGVGPKIRAALDRLVERGALVAANGAWARPSPAPVTMPAEAHAEAEVEPGPLASEEQRAEFAKKPKRTKKAKAGEVSAT
jgi:hypothetical protein